MYSVPDAVFDARFWERTERCGDCWLWTGPLVDGRYGTTTRHRRHHLAHRYAYLLTYGPIPAGIKVCHTCDTPRCINPAHLFLGTQADNVADMIQKGRADFRKNKSHGSAHYKAKLTEAAVRAIRARAASGEPRTALVAAYGVCTATISHILNRRIWTHVE